MNNPLSQKAQYYLNESSRLSEELNSQVEYSTVLEGVLEELVGTENFLKIMEYYRPKPGVGVDSRGFDADGNLIPRSKASKENLLKNLGKIKDFHDAAETASDAAAPGSKEKSEAEIRRLRSKGSLIAQGAQTDHGTIAATTYFHPAAPEAQKDFIAGEGSQGGANLISTAIASHRADSRNQNRRTGAADRARIINRVQNSGGAAITARGTGGLPREIITPGSTRQKENGFGKSLFPTPINASYEPDLMQSIRKFLVK